MKGRSQAWLLFLTALPAFAQGTAGPTPMGRGFGQLGRENGLPVSFRFFVGLNGTAESGLVPVVTDGAGNLENTTLFGGDLTMGVSGSKVFQRSAIGLGYQGSFRGYSRKAYYSGTDHIISLDYQYRLARHWQIFVRPSAGTISRAFGGVLNASFLDPSATLVPSGELFDNRLYYTQGSVDAIYQKSRRLSFHFGGDGYLVRRRSKALNGVNGTTARGDVSYRLTRDKTITAEYGYLVFDYDRAVGTFNTHYGAVSYVQALNRIWQLSLRLGGYRIESLATEQVQLDPVVAAVLGTNVGTQLAYGIRYAPQFDASVTRSRHRGTFSLVASRRLSPGNGVLLLSRNDNYNASFSQLFRKKWNFGGETGLSRYRGVQQQFGGFNSYSIGGGMTYNLHRTTFLNARFDFRSVDVAVSTFQRNTYRAMVGVAFSTPDIPLRLH